MSHVPDIPPSGMHCPWRRPSLWRAQDLEKTAALDLVVKGMQQHSADAKLQEVGCVVLGTVAAHQVMKTMVRGHGAVSAICAAMQAHPTSVLVAKNGARALSLLVANCEPNCAEVVAQGGIPCLLAAISNHPHAERTVFYSCVALRFLSLKSDDNVQEVCARRCSATGNVTARAIGHWRCAELWTTTF